MSAGITITILVCIIIALGAIASWCARKALHGDASARYWKDRAERITRDCIDYQEDAELWRAARNRRRNNRTQAQRAPILAMAEKLRAGE